jgi:hypothetical protein
MHVSGLVPWRTDSLPRHGKRLLLSLKQWRRLMPFAPDIASAKRQRGSARQRFIPRRRFGLGFAGMRWSRFRLA